jgi:hypothetical protein
MKHETIHKECNRVFGCEIRTKRKKLAESEGRAVFYFYSKEYNPKLSNEFLGEYMNGRNHSTVTIAFKKMRETYLNDAAFKEKFEKVGQILKQLEAKEPKAKIQETQQEKEISLLKMDIKRLEKENDRLRQLSRRKYDTDFKKMLSAIPLEKIENFKETRLKPYLKMNSLRKNN